MGNWQWCFVVVAGSGVVDGGGMVVVFVIGVAGGGEEFAGVVAGVFGGVVAVGFVVVLFVEHFGLLTVGGIFGYL